jgi:multidrug resistance efflux pump
MGEGGEQNAPLGRAVIGGLVLATVTTLFWFVVKKNPGRFRRRIADRSPSPANFRAALEQATANLQQGQAQEQLAKVTADRWKNLVSKGVVSRQENDTYQSQWAAAQANVSALEKAVASARSNIVAARPTSRALPNCKVTRACARPSRA